MYSLLSVAKKYLQFLRVHFQETTFKITTFSTVYFLGQYNHLSLQSYGSQHTWKFFRMASSLQVN